MKKLLWVCGILLFMPLLTMAVTLDVEALSEFSSVNPAKTMQVKLLDDVEFYSVELKSGDTITGEITNVTSPKRLKRNAKFSFIPKTYTKDNISYDFKNEYIGKYALPIDKKDLAKNAALSVGNHFVSGLTMGVNAVQGAVQNEEGNRLKSAGKNVYENSIFSYVENGQELEIHTGDRFYLKFGRDASEDEDEEEIPDNNTNIQY